MDDKLLALHERIDNDFGFHTATDVTRPMHEDIRIHCKDLAHWLVAYTPMGREQSLMLTALQECQMWANAAVAVNLAPLS